jgi:uncharacterized membrane protein YgcG
MRGTGRYDVGVARKWVFPVIRIILIAVIAVALGKLAFFPDKPAEADPAVPTGALVEPTVAVARGTITNDVVLDATVSADPAVPVKSTAAGAVDEVFAAVGASIAAGDVVFDVKVEIERDPGETVDAEGKPLPAIFRYEQVLAPISGTLSSLGVIPGQTVTIGEAAGQMAPPTYSVSGSLQPAQQYRLVSQPTEASVAITGGPAPFTCTGLSIRTPLAGASDGGSGGTGGVTGGATDGGGGAGGGGASGSTTTVSCPVPDGVTVFPGLAAQLTIAGGKAENVLVVPTTAVRGAAQTGAVWVVTADGANEERAVGLGLSDGSTVEITGGLAEGDTVLQFAPGAAAVPADGMEGCTTLPDGSGVCGPVS